MHDPQPVSPLQIGQRDFGIGRFGEFAAAVQIDFDDRSFSLRNEHRDIGPAVAVDIAIGGRDDRLEPGGDQIILLRETAERVRRGGRHARPAGLFARLDSLGDEFVGRTDAVAAENRVGPERRDFAQAAEHVFGAEIQAAVVAQHAAAHDQIAGGNVGPAVLLKHVAHRAVRMTRQANRFDLQAGEIELLVLGDGNVDGRRRMEAVAGAGGSEMLQVIGGRCAGDGLRAGDDAPQPAPGAWSPCSCVISTYLICIGSKPEPTIRAQFCSNDSPALGSIRIRPCGASMRIWLPKSLWARPPLVRQMPAAIVRLFGFWSRAYRPGGLAG